MSKRSQVRASFEEARLRRDRIVQMCSIQPMSAASISAALGLQERGADHYLAALSRTRPPRLVHSGQGRETVWMTPELRKARNMLAPDPSVGAMPSVDLMPARVRMQSAEAVVTVEKGVRITRCPSPAGRFDVAIPEGGGAITADWIRRRDKESV